MSIIVAFHHLEQNHQTTHYCVQYTVYTVTKCCYFLNIDHAQEYWYFNIRTLEHFKTGKNWKISRLYEQQGAEMDDFHGYH